jgi:hypothetical protein
MAFVAMLAQHRADLGLEEFESLGVRPTGKQQAGKAENTKQDGE